MKKTLLAMTILAALTLSLTGCGKDRPAESNTPAAEPQVTEAVQVPAEENAPVEAPETAEPQTEAPVISEPAGSACRQDGERFEAVIMLEGMEETVRYEHIRNEALGFEMDYDYENFVRYSEADRERFISDWDDPSSPDYYLEVTSDSDNAELVASAITATLSDEYEVTTESITLDGAGSCIRLCADEVKGGGYMPQVLQMVYVIPAPDGCRIATEHYSIEGAEGYGRRFAYMMNTLVVLERSGSGQLSDDQALSAIAEYCASQNPDLEEIVKAGEYPAYWEVVSSDAQQIVVLFRSYTGAQVRYYVDRATGDTHVTEFVPGITPEEEPTDTRLNVWDYLG